MITGGFLNKLTTWTNVGINEKDLIIIAKLCPKSTILETDHNDNPQWDYC